MLHTEAAQRPEPGPAYLEPTVFLDSDSPVVATFARDAVGNETGDVAMAIRLYYAVRDGWRYNPYCISLRPENYVASRIIQRNSAYCVQKAILLAAAARVVGIPAALGFSDVVNHLSTPRLLEKTGGVSRFVYHAYAVLHLDGKWVKAAPAFNRELCERFEVRPSEFDGRNDAIFQEYDARDRRHMEYVHDHGYWSDFPFEVVAAGMRATYPAALFDAEDGANADPKFASSV